MLLTELTQRILQGETLTAEDAAQAARCILNQEGTPVQVAAFLTALRARGETAEELFGFALALRELAEPFEAPEGTVLDTCGTGGDHSGTFNISTAVAFVVAGAGVRVAKHGNRSITSQCGSADVLQELGVRIDCPKEIMEKALREIGICFLFAPQYHKAMRAVAEIRRELGFRTIFNMLGPLLNPARASHQLIGVFCESCVRMHAQALKRLGSRRALVVHGADGLDEISTCAATHAAEVINGEIREFEITPEELGFPRCKLEDLHGGTAADNAAAILRILDGEAGPKTDIVLLNAGAALYVAERARSISEGIELAREVLREGKPKEKLVQLQALTAKE